MKVTPVGPPGLLLVEPRVFGDSRGWFFEAWSRAAYATAGIDADFVQDNESFSRRGVLRGLHFQAPPGTQAKLVRVIEGAVLDVAVDIRRNSPAFGRCFAVELTGENRLQLFIPRGFAHGFAVLSEQVRFAYKCDNAYMPSCERGIAFDDPDLAVPWPLTRDEAILSPKDTVNPRLRDAELPFDFNHPEDY